MEMPKRNGEIDQNKPSTTKSEFGFTVKKDLLLIPCCFYLNLFCFGFPASLGVLYAELTNQFNASHAEIAMIQSVAIGSVSLTIVWNYPVNKCGLMPCAIAASVACPVSIFVSTFSRNITMMICFLGALNGLTSAILNSVSYFIMNKYVASERSKLIALATVGGALGQLIFTVLFEAMIQSYGWRGATLLCSGLGLHMLPCTIFLYSRTRVLSFNKADDKMDKLWKPFMLKNWKFAMTLVNAFLFAVSTLTPTKFLVDYAIEKGFDRATGALFVSVIGVSNLVGRLTSVFMQICIAESSFLLLSIFTSFSGISGLILMYTDTCWGLLIGSVINGLTLGLCTSQIAICPLDIYPMEHYASGLTMVLFWYGIGNILGGYTGGLLDDFTGTYGGMFLTAFVVGVFSSITHLMVHVDTKCRGSKGYIKM